MTKALFFHIIILLSPLSLIGQESGTINVKVPDIPARRIVASIGGETSGSVHLSVLLSAKTIDVNDTTEVVNYEFEVSRAAVRTHITVQGNRLEPDIMRYLETLRVGHIVHFKKILCQDKNGLMFRLYDLQYEISGIE